MRDMPPPSRERSPEREGEPPEDVKRAKGRGSWWRSPDHELVSGRAREVKDLIKGMKGPPPGERELKEAFDEASKDPRYRNLLDMVPVKVRSLPRKDGFLLVPVYKGQTGRKVAAFLRLKEDRKVKLDRFGWAVWDLCDGTNDVGAIGAALKERFGDTIEPLFPRLSKFLAYLHHLELIEIKDPSKQ